MGSGSPLMLGIGLVLLAGGGLMLARSLGDAGLNERAVYGRRIAGMMLTAGGLALTVFSLALRHWS